MRSYSIVPERVQIVFFSCHKSHIAHFFSENDDISILQHKTENNNVRPVGSSGSVSVSFWIVFAFSRSPYLSQIVTGILLYVSSTNFLVSFCNFAGFFEVMYSIVRKFSSSSMTLLASPSDNENVCLTFSSDSARFGCIFCVACSLVFSSFFDLYCSSCSS